MELVWFRRWSLVTIRACKSFSRALGEYLRQADYYSQGMKVEGRSYGRLCTDVGLMEGAAISDDAFQRVASNHHAVTGEKLTERMAAARRAGYDAVFNAPKSVSIQAFVGGDDRLVAAHETAVAEALRELETFACHQHGRGINKRYVSSGKIAAAVFPHGESRALDPHLHSHAFIFNVTRESSNSDRMLALEASNIFERARYLTEVYRNALAREVRQLGYGIECHANGFELAGVSRELLERFSKRGKERDRAIATREAELGRELTRDEIAIVVRENRAKKQYELTPDEVRQHQLAQVSARERQKLRALIAGSFTAGDESVPLPAAIERAAEHVFERKTVVPVHEFASEVIRQSYGQHLLADIKRAVDSGTAGLLHADGQLSTKTALELERALVKQIDAGVGIYDTELGFLRRSTSSNLASEQQKAVEKILNSRDLVTVFRGKAGTGKTHTLATAIEGMAAVGRELACFAPSTQAVEVLNRDGAEQSREGRRAAGEALAQANTLQRLLVDPSMQQSITSKVVIVDEYGLLSTRQLQQLVDVAEAQRARLVLIGDSGQHKSVEAGDAARIVEKETRATVAELCEVRRQSINPAYRVAPEALAAGNIADGLQKLDAMRAVVEVENPTARRAQMVKEWFAASQETKFVRTKDGTKERAKTALMVAPTWSEIDALNAHARATLRAAGKLTGEDKSFVALRAKDWTNAQQRDVRSYQAGDVLVVHKQAKHFAKGDELRVLRREKRRLVVARRDKEISISPRQSALTWTACEERPISVAAGDHVRLRAVATVETNDGQIRRIANGSVVSVHRIDPTGHLVLADGSTLRTRQVVHAYAMTSHAAQGITVDKVFIAGAASCEGLYVSATRGRENIRVFVPDREAFLEAAGLRSESRMSALEFERQRAVGMDLQSILHRGWRFLMHVRAYFAAHVSPAPTANATEELAPKMSAARRRSVSPLP